jgi:hypothetical protein
MSEPVILDGGPEMFTIKLQTSSFKQGAQEGKLSVFSVSPDPIDEPFQNIVIRDTETGDPVFTLPLKPKHKWTIEIK